MMYERPSNPENNAILSTPWTRREFLITSGVATAGLGFAPSAAWAKPQVGKRPKVAAVFTEMRYRSHAHVILENFLKPYLFNGKLTDPGVDVVSFYGDQFPAGDMARGVSKQFKIPIHKTIDAALCRGGKSLAVDAVLSIGEHGRYPVNKYGQREYPRKRFFDEIVAVMKRSKRYVPLFNDKHLSYRWDWAKEMVDTAKQLGIPFMAGSSVPLAQRIPPFEMPKDAEIDDAVAIHGGPPESYDFHGLELLQSMVESRKRGETGISRVQFLSGDAFWAAAKKGVWSRELADAAMRNEFGHRIDLAKPFKNERPAKPHGIHVTYKDGFRATVLKFGYSGSRWHFACRLKGSPKIHAVRYYVGPWNNRNLFKALSHAIQTHFRRGAAPYPVERTLLVTGALEAAMKSRFEKGKERRTPHLEFAYTPKDFKAMREMGASWKIITEDVPQPQGINPNGGALKK
jgi:hypothetical protein